MMKLQTDALLTSPPGRRLAKAVGLSAPTSLRRHEPGAPLLPAPALAGAAPVGRLRDALAGQLGEAGAAVLDAVSAQDAQLGALVFDATGVTGSEKLDGLYDFFAPAMRQLAPGGRVLVLGTPPDACATVAEATAQRALEGFVRAVGKELRGGATANLVLVEPGAEHAMASTLRFLLSGRSAYVSGQAVRISAAAGVDAPADWERPLDARTVVVTGASRGIGEAIATVLARDGAHVVCLDIPAQGQALASVANRIAGTALQLDITATEAPATLAAHLLERHGGVDAIVHNAGITRDRTLARMSEQEWDMVLDVNLSAAERIDDELLRDGVLREHGRIVGVSSVSGIAGNRGQVNYATSKAGVIGRVEALAPRLEGGRTINAVAPGFIETQMTDAMPFATREAGRRMNSLAQGGRPVDVAEAVAWLAAPASGGVTGNVVRVCGQSLLGA
jgi:3-oxoacyl-[acyl-carrier protein] reductase